MSKIKELNPQKGDVVKIKFKSVNQIVQENIEKKSFHDIEEYYNIQDNIKAYIAGGDFLVEGTVTTESGFENDPYISVKNHFDTSYDFPIHESAIETISIVEAAEVFISNDLKLIAVRIGNEMFINGHPMIWDESKDKNQPNNNRKLVRMMERFITDLAVQDSFEYTEDDLMKENKGII